MKIKVLTLFPEMFSALNGSIVGRAIKSGKFELEIVDIRDHSLDKHRKCDDYPFGGGAGMIMSVQPIYDAFTSVDPNREYRHIYMSPKGKLFSDERARELAFGGDFIILCGHYEGVDERAIELCIDEEISLGDFVLTGGELAAMAIIDATVRFIPGVLGSEFSSVDESITSGRLEYPQYTRPAEFMGLKVPEVLLSGHHENVARWREEQAALLTEKLRPDLSKKR